MAWSLPWSEEAEGKQENGGKQNRDTAIPWNGNVSSLRKHTWFLVILRVQNPQGPFPARSRAPKSFVVALAGSWPCPWCSHFLLAGGTGRRVEWTEHSLPWKKFLQECLLPKVSLASDPCQTGEVNSFGKLYAPLNLYNEFQTNQSENKVQLEKQGTRERECLLKDFLPRPKVFTLRFACDLHIICVWLQSLSVVQIMFKLKLISRMSFSSHLSLPHPLRCMVEMSGFSGDKGSPWVTRALRRQCFALLGVLLS